ncbi:MAG: hypothetical protein Q3982_01835, partial [Phoenicibacter congonensis]|nr:hypothetical protein [Phoenicibacter congonensis]
TAGNTFRQALEVLVGIRIKEWGFDLDDVKYWDAFENNKQPIFVKDRRPDLATTIKFCKAFGLYDEQEAGRAETIRIGGNKGSHSQESGENGVSKREAGDIASATQFLYKKEEALTAEKLGELKTEEKKAEVYSHLLDKCYDTEKAEKSLAYWERRAEDPDASFDSETSEKLEQYEQNMQLYTELQNKYDGSLSQVAFTCQSATSTDNDIIKLDCMLKKFNKLANEYAHLIENTEKKKSYIERSLQGNKHRASSLQIEQNRLTILKQDREAKRQELNAFSDEFITEINKTAEELGEEKVSPIREKAERVAFSAGLVQDAFLSPKAQIEQKKILEAREKEEKKERRIKTLFKLFFIVVVGLVLLLMLPAFIEAIMPLLILIGVLLLLGSADIFIGFRS